MNRNLYAELLCELLSLFFLMNILIHLILVVNQDNLLPHQMCIETVEIICVCVVIES